MKTLIPPGKSLRFYALISWVIPGVLAGLACIAVFFGSTFLEYRAEIKRVQDEVTEKSNTVARRISAELLIGQRGAVQSVSDLLRRELSLTGIEVTSKEPDCVLKSTDTACTRISSSRVMAFRRVPVVSEPFYVSVSTKAPSLWTFFKFHTLLWSTLPIALVLGFGLVFQRIILKRYFLRPLQTLIETSTGLKEPKTFWPREVRDIADRLYRSFEVRDEEVFSQIARGVIHDLRTLIHTPLAATELVSEQVDNPTKRASRLENLNSVCAVQLPKMKEIIDNTLDGSRDISVRVGLASVSHAVEGASRTLDTLLKQTRTELRIGIPEDFIFAHDQIQLERALTNLIKNGIEACQEQETPASKIVSVSCRADQQNLTIDVEDSGPGLSVSPGRVFRALKSTKTHGSGLGLIVSRKIIEAHGGTLVAGKSKQFGGAKFSLQVPRAPEQEAQ